MRYPLQCTLACLLLAVPLSLFAQSRSGDADSGWFASVHAGWMWADRHLGGGNTQDRIDDDGFGLGAGLGYEFNRNLGIRLTYSRSEMDAERLQFSPDPIEPLSVDTDVDAWSLEVLPRLELGSGWSAYAILGAQHWRIRPDSPVSNDDGTGFVYGAGAEYRLNDSLGLGLEVRDSGVDLGSVNANLTFRF